MCFSTDLYLVAIIPNFNPQLHIYLVWKIQRRCQIFIPSYGWPKTVWDYPLPAFFDRLLLHLFNVFGFCDAERSIFLWHSLTEIYDTIWFFFNYFVFIQRCWWAMIGLSSIANHSQEQGKYCQFWLKVKNILWKSM